MIGLPGLSCQRSRAGPALPGMRPLDGTRRASRNALMRPSTHRFSGPASTRRPGPVAGATLVGMLAACGGPPGPGPDHPSTSGPEATTAAARPSTIRRTLRIAGRLDARYALISGADRRARATISAAAEVLRRQAGIDLALVSFESFEHVGPTTDALRILEALEPTADATADLTVLFSAAPAPRAVRSEHVGAREGGRAVFIRSLALYFDPSDQDALGAAEAHLLLEALGTALGALPFCGDPVMAGRFPPPTGTAAFGEANVRLLALAAAPGSARPGADHARAVQAVLSNRPASERRCAGHALAQREAVLAALLAPPPVVPPPAPPPPPRAPPRGDSAASTATGRRRRPGRNRRRSARSSGRG